MEDVLGPFQSVESLIDWLHRIGDLRVFWAKPVQEIQVKNRSPPVLRILWRSARTHRTALLVFNPEPYVATAYYGSAEAFHVDSVLFASFGELPLGGYDRWSKIFIYKSGQETLKPDTNVELEVYEPGQYGPGELSLAEEVQRESWGFYIKPHSRDYLLVAYLEGEPVGVAYYDPGSSNIDYGVHVKRGYWRRRIGTRLLSETLSLARRLGKPWVTVVRVLRSVKPVASDRRAIGFYRANMPVSEVNVYRLM